MSEPSPAGPLAGLVEFIYAQLDEEESAAKAASPGPWKADGEHGTFVDQADTSSSGHLIAEMYQCADHDWQAADAAHIARHDPARVLREVAAKRDIVRRAAACMNERDQYPNGLVSPRATLARTLVIDIGVVWSDRPGYRPEWA